MVCRSVTEDPTVERERLLNQMLWPLGAGVRRRTLDKDKIHHARPRSIRSGARLRQPAEATAPAKPTPCAAWPAESRLDSVLHQSIRCQSGAGAVQSERMSSQRVESICSALLLGVEALSRRLLSPSQSELLHRDLTLLTAKHLSHDDRR